KPPERQTMETIQTTQGMVLFLVVAVIALVALAYTAAPGWLWTIFGVIVLANYMAAAHLHPAMLTLDVLFVLVAIVLNVPPVRRALVTRHALAVFRRMLPPMSQTEREAIDAGTVWWDAELFTGKPNWRKLLDSPAPRLTPEEQSFLDNEVEELCAM